MENIKKVVQEIIEERKITSESLSARSQDLNRVLRYWGWIIEDIHRKLGFEVMSGQPEVDKGLTHPHAYVNFDKLVKEEVVTSVKQCFIRSFYPNLIVNLTREGKITFGENVWFIDIYEKLIKIRQQLDFEDRDNTFGNTIRFLVNAAYAAIISGQSNIKSPNIFNVVTCGSSISKQIFECSDRVIYVDMDEFSFIDDSTTEELIENILDSYGLEAKEEHENKLVRMKIYGKKKYEIFDEDDKFITSRGLRKKNIIKKQK